jgi:hypothetical protein
LILQFFRQRSVEVRKPVPPKRRRSPQIPEDPLDQCIFLLDSRAHEALLAMLANPAKPNKDLRERMNRKPPWEA